MGSATTRIPSSDATLVYEFDADGRHLFTRDAITNSQLIGFSYGSTGRLQTITDAEGVAVNVAYPSATQITLTAPGPNVTTITLSASTGYASTLSSGGLSWSANMGVAGLLTSLLEPGDPASHVFSYDPDGSGRLLTDVEYPLHDHRPCVTSGPRGAALSSRWSSIGRASYAERVLMTLTERGAAGP
jgi:hypothetical protein